jgi:putative hydrolase of the HAD superfamily
VTLDCAETLVAVDFQPGREAVSAARELGLDLPDSAADSFHGLMHRAWPQYRAVNESGDVEAAAEWWVALGEAWLRAEEVNPAMAREVNRAAEARIHSPEGSFKRFEDAVPALEALAARGLRLAVVSNWDFTLERVLEAAGILDRVEFAIASLPFGAEKPDPAIFAEAARRLGLPPREILHVGDDPIADFEGARAAGFQALLLDRSAEPGPKRIASLLDITGRLD